MIKIGNRFVRVDDIGVIIPGERVVHLKNKLCIPFGKDDTEEKIMEEIRKEWMEKLGIKKKSYFADWVFWVVLAVLLTALAVITKWAVSLVG